MAWGFLSCGPSEALVISGAFHKKPKLVPGGRVFVWPFIQRVQGLPLKTMTLAVESSMVYTNQGVPITVTGVAQVKIQGTDEEQLLTACEQLLGKDDFAEIQNVAHETLEGHQREIIGSLTVEEIYKDRKKFSRKVYEMATPDLRNLGFTIISYTLRDIRDDFGYLKSLGMARTAEVKRDARIGEAEAKRDKRIRKAKATEEQLAAKYSHDGEIAKAKRDYELQKAIFDLEVNTKKAESEMAYALQEAKTRQKIREEEMQIRVIERIQDIAVQDQEIMRMKRELESSVMRPAEAEKFRLEKLAEANKNRCIMEAEAEAESIKMKGEAEAYAKSVRGKAEALTLQEKAEAYETYKDAAMVGLIIDALPKIAFEMSAPLIAANKTMISVGGEIGISKLNVEILESVLRLPQLVTQLTGVDIIKGMKLRTSMK